MRVWLHGLAAAAISGAVDSLILAGIEPHIFNEPQKFLALLGAGAVKSVALYMKKSPIPSDERPPE